MQLITCTEAARQFRSGQLDPVALVDQCLAQIDRFEPAVKAWVLVDRAGARLAADRLRDELRAGHDRGPLHGIPIGVKDIIDVAGMPTLAGTTLSSRAPVERDAPVVAALREAGAIILGKTVTTQFAFTDPPPTHNPWNLARTPGGSSSGSAASVATGMCLAALGTQTAGSLMRPASFCGVACVKPDWGDVSLDGVLPISPHLDQLGAMARSASDLGTLAAVMTGSKNSLPVRPSTTPPRLGLVESYFMEGASPSVQSATRAAVDRLREAGATVTIVSPPPSFADLPTHFLRVMMFEAAQAHRQTYPSQREHYGPMISGLLDKGLATSHADYEQALAHQERFRHELPAIMKDCDAIMTPATVTTAPTPETTGDSRFNFPWNYAGWPVVSIPYGLADDGLPVAVQFSGLPGSLTRLLDVAAWGESVWKFNAVPGLVSR